MAAEKRHQRYFPANTILQRAREGEPYAFDSLFRTHKDGVYACLWHLLDGDADAVEEAVGAVFLNAYRGIGKFRMESSFSTWLYRIAVNEAHAHTRRKARQRLLGWFSMDEREFPSANGNIGGDPAGEFLRDEDEQVLWKAVRALPEPYRTPTILHYMGELDSQAISKVLKRPRGTIRYQLSRAMRILRERLGSEWAE